MLYEVNVILNNYICPSDTYIVIIKNVINMFVDNVYVI